MELFDEAIDSRWIALQTDHRPSRKHSGITPDFFVKTLNKIIRFERAINWLFMQAATDIWPLRSVESLYSFVYSSTSEACLYGITDKQNLISSVEVSCFLLIFAHNLLLKNFSS
jgi:hypothetical protein